MATGTLKVQAYEFDGQGGWPTATNGLLAYAYNTTKIGNMPQEGWFPPNLSADDSETTDGSGTATFTVTTGDNYYVCIIDCAGKPHWARFPSGYVGDGKVHTMSYQPAPFTPPSDNITELTSSSLEVSEASPGVWEIDVGPFDSHVAWPGSWDAPPDNGKDYTNPYSGPIKVTLQYVLTFPAGTPTAGTQHQMQVWVGTAANLSNIDNKVNLEYETGCESPAQATLRTVDFWLPGGAHWQWNSSDGLTAVYSWSIEK